tara:strand:+ start:6834 stop:8222 length:1389 start_codon:yes stop_codon:yes gene_type:complete
MQIPILSGITTDESADFSAAYPVNLVPVPGSQGISDGYLRPADGIVERGVGDGACRGGIVWQDVLYMVLGTRLTRVGSDGSTTNIGVVAGTDRVTLTYSFSHLAVAGGGNLYLYDGTAFARVTDVDLGTVLSVAWQGGYLITTDGEFLVTNELADPFEINPLRYGSSEVSPDPVVAVLRLRNEIYAVNKNTIEVFQNVGGTGFPFQRAEGAMVSRGAISSDACCVFAETIAFVGGGEGEALAVWTTNGGAATKVSTRDVDKAISNVADKSAIFVQSRLFEGHANLYIHLPDQAFVYDAAATAALGRPVWHRLQSGAGGPWRVGAMVFAYGEWWVGDTQSGSIGVFAGATGEHWGEKTTWQFNTPIIYNSGMGAIVHELELVSLTGRVAVGAAPVIATEYSLDGATWSQRKTIKAGTTGQRRKRLVWLQQGPMDNLRMQRFTGDSDAHLTFARLEAKLEPLAF